jgi:ubiquinone biosynthesis protein
MRALSAFGDLIPEEYAGYRPLLAQGLQFFLERLPPARQAAILGEQLGMPAEATAVERIATLARQSPVLHKLGQVVARDPRLPPALRVALQQLESMPSGRPMQPLRVAIEAELGTVTGLRLGAAPLAEASVAVVVPFVWQGGGGVCRQGVFKLLKPGVEECLADDLAVLPDLGARLASLAEAEGLPPLPYEATFDLAVDLLTSEIRLGQEQAHLVEARRFHTGAPDIWIPDLLPYCTPRLTAMERVFGRKVTDHRGTPASAPALAAILVQRLVAEPFWQAESGAPLFHADPHAGNLFLADDGRLAVLDWSLVVRPTKQQRERLALIVVGAMMLDREAVCAAVATLAHTPGAPSALTDVVDAALREVRRGVFPGVAWLTRLLDRAAVQGGVVFPRELTLLRKLLLTLTGVLEDVAPGFSPDTVLLEVGLRRFLRELPMRGIVPAHSRAFGTHLSNLDLLRVWSSAPVIGARWWLGALHEVLREGWAARPAR